MAWAISASSSASLSSLTTASVGASRLAAAANPDCAIALPPSGLRDAFLRVVRRMPRVTEAVHDTPENILERITFDDVDSRPIDKHLTGEERILYLKEIKADIAYFKRSYARADLQVIITGFDPEASAAAIDARLEIQQRVARGEQGNTGE